ncbi:3-hydroxyacyl-CoA dehydrogenase NAD-binding domain-containing protein [Mesorhizobium sp. M1312]|uniref:3-hydroxyacyl-CoA dehydrogenase NAD-binding domain-containing protein n=1 Tax=unclassified Mesorhizobium TaxID=325217 RepID=UPI00333AB0A8
MSESATRQAVRLERRGGIGVIIIDNPPINAGSLEVRHGLLKAVLSVDSDEELSGGLLIGAAGMFMAGSDIREFGTPLKDPQLPSVIAAIEDSAKPFVAAIAGAALGGGYELALACDGRIASPEAVVGLPETTLGLIPGAGGTQRLPRLVGQEKAVELICAGTRVPAIEAVKLGMIDAVAQRDLESEALAFLAGLQSAKRRVSDKQVPESDPVSFAKTKAHALISGRHRPHIKAAITAIEQCGRLPFKQGLADERAEFQKLRVGREASALRHLFFAERKAVKVAEAAASGAIPIEVVAVIGGGTMGAGIAAALLGAGKSVIIVESTLDAAARALDRVQQGFQRRVERGRLDPAQLGLFLSRLTVTADARRVGEADAVVEAVFEDIGAKQQVFEALGSAARPDAVLLTNTSYLSVSEIAAFSGRPQDVAGMHFFSPADVMRLVEIVRHADTSARVTGAAYDLALTMGKLPVLSKDSFGFIGNRIFAAYRRQCEFMLEEGALPHEIDSALEAFGFAMGPFAVADLSGLDISWRMRQATAPLRKQTDRYVIIPDLLCEAGRFGRKTGAGYYLYPASRGRGEVDPIVTDLIIKASSEAGRVRRPISASEIVNRAMAAMASEAAWVISEGVTHSPSDIDLVLTNGYGFPKHEGGILFWARNQDRASLDAAFTDLVESHGSGFQTGPVTALLLDKTEKAS